MHLLIILLRVIFLSEDETFETTTETKEKTTENLSSYDTDYEESTVTEPLPPSSISPTSSVQTYNKELSDPAMFLTTSESIFAEIGSPVRLVCSSKNPIKTCSFKVPGVSQIIVAPHFDKKCGIIIKDFQETMFGTTLCNILTEDEQLLSGTIKISRPLAVKTLWMRIKNQKRYQAGDVIQAYCYKGNTAKDETIHWYLNGRYLGLGEFYQYDYSLLFSDFYSFSSSLNYTLTAADHGQTLTCLTKYSKTAVELSSRGTIQLFVNFKPEIVVEVISKIEAGNPGSIGPIIVTANPKPQFEWFVNGKLLTSSGNEKFVANTPTQIDTNRFSASLSYNSLTETELNPKIELKATNEFGSCSYIIVLDN